MGNDIEIRVRVANQTATGLASVNTSLNTLRDRADRASTALRGLNTRADAATRSISALAGAAIAAAVGVQRLAAAASDASGELSTLRSHATRTGTALRNLGSRAEDAEDRLDFLNSTAVRLSITMDGLGDSSRGAGGDLNLLRGSLGAVTTAGSGAASALGGGGGGGGLKGQLVGVAAILGASFLPSIGALSPMLFGLAGVGGAAALAMKDLKTEFKKLKPEFEAMQKVASKAVMPGVKRSIDDLKGAMKGLEPVIKVGGEAFGDFVESAAEFADSPAFQSALLTNVKMGSEWFGKFGDSVFDFTQSFLDFGTKSGPSLDAWERLLGGVLDTGLPGMFDGLEQGIEGSSGMIEGLAELLNQDLLPSIGRVSGSFAEAFGPLVGEMLDGAGLSVRALAGGFEMLMEVAEPFVGIIADGFRAFNEIGEVALEVAGNLARSLGGALLESLLEVSGVDTSKLGNGFRGFSDLVKENEPAIRGAFYNVADAITVMVQAGVSMLPELWTAFQFMTEGALTSMDGLISGMAALFGDLPGMDFLNDMNSRFDEFSEGFRGTLDEVGSGIGSFVETAQPKLDRLHLKFAVDEAKANLDHIKGQLADPELTKERKAKLSADKKAAEDALAKAKTDLSAFDKEKATAKLDGNPSPFFSALGQVNRSKVKDKSGKITANTGPFMSSIGGLAGKVLGTSYINIAYRRVEAQNAPPFKRAHGGPIRLADGGSPGGRVVGPGSETSDSVPALLSAGEYVIRASSVRKYGERFMEAVNSGNLKPQGFAKGGMSQSMKDARSYLGRSLNISHFGQAAGYKNDPLQNLIGSPDDLAALVRGLNDLRGQIKAAFTGGKESSLLKQLDSVGKKLIGYEKQLESVNKSLATAKSKLDDLKSASTALASSVKSGILSSANITKGAGGGAPVTVSSVMAGLTQSRDKATAFQQALEGLKAKGLSSSLIQQIAEAGIDGGGLETAGALLSASASEIKSMNSLQSQINTSATAAGKTTADAVYAAAIKAQTIAVQKLQTTQDKLEKAMRDLTKSLEKSLSKALKGKAAGGIIGAATGGLRSGWTMVGEHEPELVRLPFGSRVYSGPDTRRIQQEAWTSMLNTTPARAGAVRREALPASSAQPLVVQLRIGDRDLGEVLIDPIRKAVATRGGNVQATLGQGGH
ncbi:hypothetical protein [Streptomyces sp. NPDC088789]|uniref:hypothetical protein n=1 Tax=Streptomyces sp. NPDC088789 TaxID=3365899 RepID=UPI003801506A